MKKFHDQAHRKNSSSATGSKKLFSNFYYIFKQCLFSLSHFPFFFLFPVKLNLKFKDECTIKKSSMGWDQILFSSKPVPFLILYSLLRVTSIIPFLKGLSVKDKCLKVAPVHLENDNISLNAVNDSDNWKILSGLASADFNDFLSEWSNHL